MLETTMETHARGTKETAGEATAEEGEVVLDGPDGVAVTMTSDAADGTAISLHAAAAEARDQRKGR
jgi:hypothetical protein